MKKNIVALMKIIFNEVKNDAICKTMLSLNFTTVIFSFTSVHLKLQRIPCYSFE